MAFSSVVQNFVINNAQAFLAARNIDFDFLNKVAHRQCDPSGLLLTSSAVHGIATMASDIDMLCVVDEVVSTEQMATQVHQEGLHLELLMFNSTDVHLALQELASLAQKPTLVCLQEYSSWDVRNKIPRKYVERLVYGVTHGLTTPYLSALDDLSVVVSRKDLDVFRMNIACSRLAQRSDEIFAAVGYLMNALIAAMNSLLSMSGWVLSNKKWTLRRWNKSRDLVFLGLCPTTWIEVSALWADVAKGPRMLDEALSRTETLLQQITSRQAPELLDDEALIGFQGDVRRYPLHGQAALVCAGDGYVRLAENAPTGLTLAQRFTDLDQLPRLSALEHLQAIRAGTWSPSLQRPSVFTNEGAQHV
ncbi:hypothetical protein ALP05_200001 [Pseudomonas caricapapayae]|uniref:Uncharacterized protein n=2 Tax=Pseudomonas caricapapayae TaxID=46678 RepID=A0A3M6ES08_9PSED|nr:hypothetical protein ALP05_200001 [Pseudomonas caricapapayae]